MTACHALDGSGADVHTSTAAQLTVSDVSREGQAEPQTMAAIASEIKTPLVAPCSDGPEHGRSQVAQEPHPSAHTGRISIERIPRRVVRSADDAAYNERDHQKAEQLAS